MATEKRGPGRPRKTPAPEEQPQVQEATETGQQDSPNTEDKVKSGVKRPRRTALDGPRDLMTAFNLPDNVRPRWVNDVKNNVLTFIERGYQFVHKTKTGGLEIGERTVESARQAGSVVSKPVDTDKSGKPIIAYLMAQDKDFFEEDQRLKEQQLVELEKALSAQDAEEGLLDAESDNFKKGIETSTV